MLHCFCSFNRFYLKYTLGNKFVNLSCSDMNIAILQQAPSDEDVLGPDLYSDQPPNMLPNGATLFRSKEPEQPVQVL